MRTLRFAGLCALLVGLVACSQTSTTSPTTAGPSVKTAAEGIPGPVIMEYDYSCEARDREVAKKVAPQLHPNTILTLDSGHKVYLVDTARGYDISDYPSNWCLGKMPPSVGNVSHITTIDTYPISRAEFERTYEIVAGD